ncbi:MAG: DNA-binding response regulator [Deltaproteobacteria bacterium]|nr:DNA-binding response regulator [Deltaproteobacteria bacterium]
MLQHKRLVLIDDDEIFCKTFSSLLGIENEVQTSSHLTSARSLIKERIFDCILLDKNLPDGSGEDLLKELGAQSFSVPIIILSGDSEFGSIMRCLAAGAADYLIKSESLMAELFIRIPIVIEKWKRHLIKSIPATIDDLTPGHLQTTQAAFEKSYLEAALKLVNHNITELARRLGLSRATLFNKINEHQIVRQYYRTSSTKAMELEK